MRWFAIFKVVRNSHRKSAVQLWFRRPAFWENGGNRSTRLSEHYWSFLYEDGEEKKGKGGLDIEEGPKRTFVEIDWRDFDVYLRQVRLSPGLCASLVGGLLSCWRQCAWVSLFSLFSLPQEEWPLRRPLQYADVMAKIKDCEAVLPRQTGVDLLKWGRTSKAWT